MIRHVEFTINFDFDLTCWGVDKEDFEADTEESIRAEIGDFLQEGTEEVLKYLVIKKVWYEEDE